MLIIIIKGLRHVNDPNDLLGVPQRYDYGRSENMRIYGTVDPPLYNFSRITTPFALIYGRSDALGKQKVTKK